MESRLLPPSSSTWPNLLHGVNDLPWLHRAWVDDLIYVAQVAVRKGSGDVDEGFKLWHLAGHQQELLGGNDIQLHSFSGEDKAEEAERHSASCLAVPGVPHCECTSSSDCRAVLIQVADVPSFNWCMCHDYTFVSNRQMAQILVAHHETRRKRIGPWLHNSVTLEIVMYSCYVWDLSLSQGSTVHTVSRGYMVLISKTENTWSSELIKWLPEGAIERTKTKKQRL